MKSLVLASTSPYRRALLEKIAIPFTTARPDVDETPQRGESPTALVERLAINKAQAVADQFNDALIIGSDQVAVFKNEVLGKPHTEGNAIKQLTKFSGNQVTFLTGLCVYDTNTHQFNSIVEPFNVHFRQLDLDEITNYIHIEQPLNCAGSFKIEGLGISLFEKLDGDDPNALIGLPLIKLLSLLRSFNYNILKRQLT